MLAHQTLTEATGKSHVGAISKVDVSSLIISLVITGGISVAFLVQSNQYMHWFVIPVAACGVVIGDDAINWFRGRLRVFDPVGIIGLLGFHFFFLAPLLHVHWDFWMNYVSYPSDWRPWLGRMALFNLAGLVMYRFARRVYVSRDRTDGDETGWRIDPNRFPTLLFTALAVTGLLQLLVYESYGGISGYIRSYSSSQAGFEGMGVIFMFSESFPILALFGYVLYARSGKRTRTWLEIGAVLLIFLVLKLLFGGLRGSRSNTVWGLFWAVSLIHLFVRPVSRKMILVGLIPLVIFLYAYGFYKSYGADVFEVVQDTNGSLTALEERSGRSLENLLLSDLGRSDVQAFLLYRLNSPKVISDYSYALGRTYIGGVGIMVPSVLWQEPPEGKVKWGTNALYGEGAFESRGASTRVYGLAGEALLNFGVVAMPLSFIVLGLAVGKVRRWFVQWGPEDSRLLLYPLLINLCFVLLIADSENIVFFLMKNGFVPIAIVALSSRRQSLPRFTPSAEKPVGAV